ncbi:hypothetical protein BGZ76_008775 [Entomortierella beljakovae]|nr:hypothetical protein BGZ76_008775 [Entomortierella beljakovae]
MTTLPSTLRRETTRTLCDEFTTLFDQSELILNISSSQEKVDTETLSANNSFSLSQTASQMASLELNSLSSLWNSESSEQESIVPSSPHYALPSPAASAVSPASTPYIDSEELLMVETLSPPASPWFPSALDLGKCLPEDQDCVSATQENNFKSNSNDPNKPEINENTVTNSSHMEFFNNPFYESLAGAKYHQRSHPYHSFQHRNSASAVATAVRSSKTSHITTENNRTAAPSDLFNVTIDEILSSDPLNLGDLDLIESEPRSPKLGSDTTSDVDVDYAISMIMAVAEQVAEQVAGSQASSRTDNAEVEAITLDQENSIFGTDNSSQESALSISDDDDGSDYEVGIKTNAKKRVRSSKGRGKSSETVSASSTSSSSKRRSSSKAPRPRRKAAKKAPKVYPPRKTKSLDASHESDNGSTDDNGQDRVDALEKSRSSSSISIDVKGIGKNTYTAEDGSYRCAMCPLERFGRVHDLKRHQISKHNEKTWPCDFCRRPFVRRDALLRHYAVKAERRDGLHPTLQESNRLSEARARARLRV